MITSTQYQCCSRERFWRSHAERSAIQVNQHNTTLRSVDEVILRKLWCHLDLLWCHQHLLWCHQQLYNASAKFLSTIYKWWGTYAIHSSSDSSIHCENLRSASSGKAYSERIAWERVLGSEQSVNGRPFHIEGQPPRRYVSAWWGCEQKEHWEVELI